MRLTDLTKLSYRIARTQQNIRAFTGQNISNIDFYNLARRGRDLATYSSLDPRGIGTREINRLIGREIVAKFTHIAPGGGPVARLINRAAGRFVAPRLFLRRAPSRPRIEFEKVSDALGFSEIQLVFDIDGVEETAEHFEGAEERISDLRPVWRSVARVFFHHERRQFESEGAWFGTRWPPLSPRYKAWKEKHYPGKPMMVLTETLKRSLTSFRSPYLHYRATRRFLELGTKVPYALKHQVGDGVPKRPIVGMTREEKAQMVKVLKSYILKGMFAI
jgi:phage gpG-like protein